MAGMKLSLWTFLLVLLILILLAVVVWILIVPINQEEVEAPNKNVVEQVEPEEFLLSELKTAHNTWFEGLLAEDTSMLEGILSDDITFLVCPWTC